MLILSRLAGTLASVFRIGTLKLKDVAGTLVLRNATDTQHANLEINRLKMIYGPANGAILSSDANGLATWKDPSDLGLGANEFTDLIDVPSTYIPGKFVAVNEAGDGLEFVDAPAGSEGGSGGAGQVLFTFEGDLEVGASPLRIYNATDTVKLISKVFLSLSDAPTGADVIVDVHKDGISIFASQDDRPKVLATETTGETLLGTEVEWAPGEYLTAEIDQIGSTFPGANLVVHVIATGEFNGGGGGGAITIQEADGEPFVTGVKTLKVPNGTLVSEGDGVARLALGQYDPGPDFDASDIEGLYCWYKSDTGVTLNGSTVSQWEDIGPFAYHATQGTGGRQPFYIPLSPLAGYPAIAFDGVDDFLVTNAKPALGANARTLVAVGYGAVSQPGGGYMHIVHYGNTSGGQSYGITSRTNGSAFFGNHYWSNQMVTAVWGELGPFILLMTYNGTTDYCYYNGLLVGTRNLTLNTGSGWGLHIGSRISAPSECGRFCLTELMAFNRYLEASDRIDLVTALGLKYRINVVTEEA